MKKRAKTDPLVPVRADYRLIKKLLDSSYKVVHLPEEYDMMIEVFRKAGGSWRAVFDGDIDHLVLLKKIIRLSYKNKHLTRLPSWD